MGKSKDIKEAVRAELVFDPLVDDTAIEVQNLEGDVRLNGIVPSYSQYLEAADAARRVAGVKRVHNHLEVVLPDWAVRDDATLSDIANNALLWDVTVPVGVEASAKDGNITLTGTVAYGSQRIAAEGAVAGLTGVRGIKNRIEISPDADPVDVEILVSDALDRYALFDDSEVTVLIDGSTVTLAGYVRTWAEHDAVVLAAWMANGVLEVKDDLSITG